MKILSWDIGIKNLSYCLLCNDVSKKSNFNEISNNINQLDKNKSNENNNESSKTNNEIFKIFAHKLLQPTQYSM